MLDKILSYYGKYWSNLDLMIGVFDEFIELKGVSRTRPTKRPKTVDYWLCLTDLEEAIKGWQNDGD